MNKKQLLFSVAVLLAVWLLIRKTSTAATTKQASGASVPPMSTDFLPYNGQLQLPVPDITPPMAF
jgi:hypothetical protein